MGHDESTSGMVQGSRPLQSNMTLKQGSNSGSGGGMSTGTGVLTVLLTLLGWSSVPLFITHFSSSIDAYSSNGWRYGFSALLWAPALIWGWARSSLPAGLWRAAIVPSIFNAAGQTAFAWSFYEIDPTTATFGLRLQIVFVSIGAFFLFPSERALLRRTGAWAGIALVFGGIMGTIFLGSAGKSGLSSNLPGVVLAISAGLLFACYALIVRRNLHGFHPVTAFAAISQYTAVMMVGLMVALGERHGATVLDTAILSRGQFGLLLLSAIIGIALGHVFYYISIARLGVAVSSGVIQLQPFFVAIGASVLFPDKPLTIEQLVAGSIAVCGAVLLLFVQWRVAQEAKRAQAAAAMAPAPVHVTEPYPHGVVISEADAARVEASDLDAVPTEPRTMR